MHCDDGKHISLIELMVLVGVTVHSRTDGNVNRNKWIYDRPRHRKIHSFPTQVQWNKWFMGSGHGFIKGWKARYNIDTMQARGSPPCQNTPAFFMASKFQFHTFSPNTSSEACTCGSLLSNFLKLTEIEDWQVLISGDLRERNKIWAIHATVHGGKRASIELCERAVLNGFK